MLETVIKVAIGFDIMVAGIIPGGRRYQTISSRLGENMRAGGWASRFPFPAWFVEHCLESDRMVDV